MGARDSRATRAARGFVEQLDARAALVIDESRLTEPSRAHHDEIAFRDARFAQRVDADHRKIIDLEASGGERRTRLRFELHDLGERG